MTQKIKKSIAAISAVATVLTSLLYFQGNILANAEEFDSNGFASDGTYQKADLTTDKYDIDNNGEFDDVYEISNAGQLYWFANEVGYYGRQNAVLTADIIVNTGNISDFNGENKGNWINWKPISSYGFEGIFEGQGHTISGLYYNGSDENAGLFGYLYNGKILNVGVENSYFNCSGTYAGGICGRNSQGTISGCYSKGTVKCSVDVGGVVGYNEGTVINCYNNGFVDGQSSQYVGGICAFNNGNGNISNCYNTGKITFSGASGGICGDNYGTVENCYYLDTCKGDDNIYSEFGCKAGTETTSKKFASGEIAYLLQNEQNENIWGQELDKDDFPVLKGMEVYENKVYSGCEGNKGDADVSYSNTKEPDKYADHNYSKGGICTYCNKIENDKDGFKSASLALTDGVIMNYYMLLSDDVKKDSGAYIQFTSENGINKKVMISSGIENVNSDGTLTRYIYSIELRPDQMADEITAQVFYGNGKKGSSINYSVKQYVESIEDGENYKELADTMLRYGAYTQLYTGRNTENMAVEVQDYSENKKIGDEYKYSLSEKISGIEVKSATLLVGSDTTIRVKYQLSSDYKIGNFYFKCRGEEVIPEKSGDSYYLYIKNIKPQNLDNRYTFYVYNLVTEEELTLDYSAFSYMKNVLGNSESYDKNLVNLVNAMYEYNQKAKEYISY